MIDAVSPATADGPTSAGTDDRAALRELLAEIHRDMAADTATVLLLDQTRAVLEPAATIGLGTTLSGARRVPVGQGFAGRVAQSRQPISIAEVTSDEVINPVLLDHGVRSLLGVPVVHGSELIGVLHVGFLTHHRFGDLERRRLSDHGREIGRLVRHQLTDAEHTAALALQRSLLPAVPVSPAGVAIAARYVPAVGDLGGDWYDAFELPDGRLGLVMGDVMGHGLDAAVVMGRLRSALRAYALDHADPAEVLRRLDRKICHFEPDVLATVVFAVSAAPYERWQVSSAGHLPPMLASPGARGEMVDLPTDPLLGVTPDAVRHSSTLTLPPGSFLCLYTDGLIERRPAPGDSRRDIVAHNLDRLADAMGTASDAELCCIRVLTQVVGQEPSEDDIAVLVAQRSPADAS